MRTAITLGRTKGGWKLLSGPDVPADKQRARYNDLSAEWPEDLLEIRYQSNDGLAKSRTREKAEAVQSHTRNAEKHAAEKVAAAKKREVEELKAAEIEAAAKKKLVDDQRARELKAKADAKAR